MAKRFAVAGRQNTGKSYPRRWIPDGDNVAILQPSNKYSYLFSGPPKAHLLSPAELDQAIENETRQLVPEFDIISPEGKYNSLQEAYDKLMKNKTPTSIPLDILGSLVTHKATGYFKKEHIPGSVFFAPTFDHLKLCLQFIDKLMPWIHTVILPDFTHFITAVITSDVFLNQNSSGQAYQRYLKLAADAFKNFISESDNLRKDLVIVTEYHTEFNEAENVYELFVPGGKMVKEKFLPSSYYDVFLFTDVDYGDMSDEAEPIYRYVTRKTRKYPEARSMGIFPDLYVPNDLHSALTKFRKYHGIPVLYDAKMSKVA